MKYAGYEEVEAWVRETSPTTKGVAAYTEFALWIRAKGAAECRALTTFSHYRAKAQLLVDHERGSIPQWLVEREARLTRQAAEKLKNE
jgi:hypothetical protein